MSSLSDGYIQSIENNYYLPRKDMTQVNKYKIIFNNDHKKMIESFCDHHVNVILKGRGVGSTTTICSYIIEYCLKNSNCCVCIHQGKEYLFDMIRSLIPNNEILLKNNKNLIVFENKSKIMKLPHDIRGFEPNIIYFDEITHLKGCDITKKLEQLSELWRIGVRPKIIMDSFYLGYSSEFYKFIEKNRNNSNVNVVELTNTYY